MLSVHNADYPPAVCRAGPCQKQPWKKRWSRGSICRLSRHRQLHEATRIARAPIPRQAFLICAWIECSYEAKLTYSFPRVQPFLTPDGSNQGIHCRCKESSSMLWRCAKPRQTTSQIIPFLSCRSFSSASQLHRYRDAMGRTYEVTAFLWI